MGLFERLGEKAQRVKRQVDEARTDSARYRCRSCGNLVYSDLDRCPECDSDDLKPRGEPAEEESDDAGSSRDGAEPAEEASARDASTDPESDRE